MKRVTLTQYLIEQQRSAGTVSPELRLLIEVVARACKTISHAVGKGALGGCSAASARERAGRSAEEARRASPTRCCSRRTNGAATSPPWPPRRWTSIAPDPEPLPEGEYLLLFDPLDGSLEHRRQRLDRHDLLGAALPGRRTAIRREGLPAAGRAAGRRRLRRLRPADHAGADGRRRRRVLHARPRDRLVRADPGEPAIPEDTQEFAINMSNARHWEAPVKRYIDECLAGKTGPRGKDFNMRWVASMVADVHRILHARRHLHVPARRASPTRPGKLRLMYEANPMAFIVEQAGGAATNGTQRILDIQPTQAAPARRGVPRLEERSRAGHALPPREVIRRIAIVLMFVAGEAAAQKDVADPLEHFLGTTPPGRAKHALDDGVGPATRWTGSSSRTSRATRCPTPARTATLRGWSCWTSDAIARTDSRRGSGADVRRLRRRSARGPRGRPVDHEFHRARSGVRRH